MITENELLQELRTEAIDTVEDRLAGLSETLQRFGDSNLKSRDILATVKLEVHSLKTVAASFDMKALKAVCHRCEDYIFNLTDLAPQAVVDIQTFADRMSECLDAFVNNRDVDISQLVRKLPAKRASFEVGDVTVTDMEVMLVMEPGTANKIVTRELLECGYRMVNVASTMDAIQLIPSMRPDLVIVSRVMPELSGVDLACALRAMPSTRGIPVALLASIERNDPHLNDLPKDVPVLRKGTNFSNDVADVFVKLGIL